MIIIKINKDTDGHEKSDYAIQLTMGCLKAWKKKFKTEESTRNCIVINRLEHDINGMSRDKLKRIVYGN